MTKNDIARAILKHTNMLSNVTRTGDLKKALGESFQAALDLGWIHYDHELGMVKLGNAAKVVEMRKFSESTIETKSSVLESTIRDFIKIKAEIQENSRDLAELKKSVKKLTEAQDDTMYDIGDDIEVVEDGQTYQGKVQAKGSDGKLKISFGAKKPMKVKDYDKQELKLVKKSETKPATGTSILNNVVSQKSFESMSVVDQLIIS